MKIQNLALSILTAILFTACGGGDRPAPEANSASPVAGVSKPQPVNTGSVSAPYEKSNNARYILIGTNSQLANVAAPVIQDSSGVLTTISENILTGSPTATGEINGNASYAMGRWFAGTVTIADSTRTYNGTTNDSFHYLVTNNLAAMPAWNGSMECDGGRFTAPSSTSATPVQPLGMATGSATVYFDGINGTAAASMTVNVTAGGGTGSIDVSGTIIDPASNVSTGEFDSAGQGGLISIADGGVGTALVIGAYRINLSNGTTYQGVATFHCN